MDATLTLNTQSTARAFARLKSASTIAIPRALNKSIASGKTLGVRLIAEDMGLRQADVRDRIGLKQATPDNHVASLSASFKRVPLIDFNATGPEPSFGKGRGVRARFPGGAGRYPRAFIATMKSGHRGVFERTGASNRLPIHELFGPSLAFVFVKHRPEMQARALEQLAKNLQHELRFALTQAA
jgi:hypothetical protein